MVKFPNRYLAEISKAGIIGKVYKNHQKFDETLRMLKKGFCKEIVGMEYSSEP